MNTFLTVVAKKRIPSGFGITHTDDFNRANGGLGANWTSDSSFPGLVISSNKCKGTTAANHNVACYTAGGTVAANQWAQVTVGATNGYMGPILRGNALGTFYVCFYPTGTTAGTLTLFKYLAGSGLNIISGNTVTPTVGDVIYFQAVGVNLTAKVNGVTVATSTDVDIAGSGYPGVLVYSTSAAIDDFDMGAI